MAIENDFKKCIGLLDEVTRAFLDARTGLAAPSRYEADLAAFQLMEVSFRHINAVSGIAMMPKPGSHLISAWSLLRSAFDISLTATWLADDPDWKEREARWLGWIAGEETYQRKLAGDIRKAGGTRTEKLDQYAADLEKRRLQIMRLLPRDSRKKRPEIPLMLRECGLKENYYIVYRIGSQLTHGGPACIKEVWKTGVHDGKPAFFFKDIAYAEWSHPLQLAGWCIAQAGSVVLLRAGADPEAVNQMIEVHKRLIEASSLLSE